MTTTNPTATPEPRSGGWPDYRAVWRWHFYAGLLCIPFVIWLACTGSIYLFKPQVEAFIDRGTDRIVVAGPAASPSAQVAAAVAAVPGSALASYETPQAPGAAVRVLVSQGADLTRVYVHPSSLEILKTVPEDDRFMEVVFRLHGELLAGERGSNIVELAACWAIVMILTGLFLWWPRQSSLAGVIYPRFHKGSRHVWRDLHAVTGFWVSLFAIFLLLTGLPWAKNWGGYFKEVRKVTGATAAAQDWNTSRAEAAAQRRADDAGVRATAAVVEDEHAQHNMAVAGGGGMHHHTPGMVMPGMAPEDAYAPLDRVAPTIAALKLPPPVLISPPKTPGAPWTAKTDTPNRPQRVDFTVDGETGKLIGAKDFSQKHLIDKIVGVGIAAHEGQLFGWANQLLGLFTAIGLVLLSVSAVVLWWRRRSVGALGAPEAIARPRLSVALVVIVLALGLYLPMFGVSLLTVLAVERLVLRRIPPVRDWLGLQRERPAKA